MIWNKRIPTNVEYYPDFERQRTREKAGEVALEARETWCYFKQTSVALIKLHNIDCQDKTIWNMRRVITITIPCPIVDHRTETWTWIKILLIRIRLFSFSKWIVFNSLSRGFTRKLFVTYLPYGLWTMIMMRRMAVTCTITSDIRQPYESSRSCIDHS
jgi:hypothetical protein